MTEVCFDRVVVAGELGHTYSLQEFLQLPIHERIHFILKGQLSFYLGSKPVDRKLALASLRVTSSSAAVARAKP